MSGTAPGSSEGPGDRLFGDDVWQMALGERAAIVGLLAELRPALAIEIGTAEGASLRRIAEHSREVHSFDVVRPSVTLPGNVTLHTGDNHVLLPEVLRTFADEGRNVDFALVDGDHSSEGVRRDLEDLLSSSAIGRTVIVTHDTGNEVVRAGLDAVDFGAFPKVRHVDLDLVPGHLGRDRFPGELWYGLGLILVGDIAVTGRSATGPVQTDRHHGGQLLAVARDALEDGGGVAAGPEATAARLAASARRTEGPADEDRRVAELSARVAGLEGEVQHHRALWSSLVASPSWRLTAPLRAIGRAARRIRRSRVAATRGRRHD